MFAEVAYVNKREVAVTGVRLKDALKRMPNEIDLICKMIPLISVWSSNVTIMRRYRMLRLVLPSFEVAPWKLGVAFSGRPV